MFHPWKKAAKGAGCCLTALFCTICACMMYDFSTSRETGSSVKGKHVSPYFAVNQWRMGMVKAWTFQREETVLCGCRVPLCAAKVPLCGREVRLSQSICVSRSSGPSCRIVRPVSPLYIIWCALAFPFSLPFKIRCFYSAENQRLDKNI